MGNTQVRRRPGPSPVSVPRRPLTVLVVDDDDDMRAYLGACVGRLGDVRVVEAGDGMEALRLARALLPDLVLTDMVMPRMDGAELCRTLREDPVTAHIRLVVVSGETREPPPCADGFLTKPFNALTLREQARHALPPHPSSQP